MPITDFYKDIINDARDFYGNQANQPQYYSGTTVADFDPLQQQAFQQVPGVAQAQTGLGGEFANTVSQGLQGGLAYDPSGYQASTYQAQGYDNPFLQQQANLLGGQAAAAARQGAAGAGTLGGTRASLAAGEAAARATTPLYAGCL